jgi:hypothetical protein
MARAKSKKWAAESLVSETEHGVKVGSKKDKEEAEKALAWFLNPIWDKEDLDMILNLFKKEKKPFKFNLPEELKMKKKKAKGGSVKKYARGGGVRAARF